MKYFLSIIFSLSFFVSLSQRDEKIICYCENDSSKIKSISYLNSNNQLDGTKKEFDCRSGKLELIENYDKGNLNGTRKKYRISRHWKYNLFGKRKKKYKRELKSKEKYFQGKLNGPSKYLGFRGASHFKLFDQITVYKEGNKHGKEIIKNTQNGFKIFNDYISDSLIESDTSVFLFSTLFVGKKYKLHTYGMPRLDPPIYYYHKENKQEKIYYKSVAGCVVSYRIMRKSAKHNKRFVNKLERNFGQDWRDQFIPKYKKRDNIIYE